ADQLGKVMNMMSASLGVDCKFCHASNDGDFEKEGFEHKDAARDMLTMMFDLNKKYFKGRPEVNCNTCHQGISHPQPSFPLQSSPQPERAKRLKQPVPVEDVLAKYENAIGGKANLAKITSRQITAKRIEPNGTTFENETVFQSGNKMAVSTTYTSEEYGDYVIHEVYDGVKAAKFGGTKELHVKADELEQIKREAQILSGADLNSVYQKMDVRAIDKIDGREVYVVTANVDEKNRERLYFDVENGLLVRRIAFTPTVLGNFQFQIDYSDYKDFGGVKLPTSIKFAVPHISWTRKILDVKNNVRIDDAKFSTSE
ncbi:MAG: photosynthetic reaction center cytochrome c subunit, partial [Acidobacteria bacterium]|nr:photosynthetic reaction center cytochrome c subunit [Acidobacteriota bacterium]